MVTQTVTREKRNLMSEGSSVLATQLIHSKRLYASERKLFDAKHLSLRTKTFYHNPCKFDHYTKKEKKSWQLQAAQLADLRITTTLCDYTE